MFKSNIFRTDVMVWPDMFRAFIKQTKNWKPLKLSKDVR